jgi:hypothetical protein
VTIPRSPLVWQLAVVVMLLVVAAATPPRRGAMLLVPIDGDAGVAVRTGVAFGAALVRAGPFPGSVVMWGDRAALVGPTRAAGILLLAAPPGGCAAGEPEKQA